MFLAIAAIALFVSQAEAGNPGFLPFQALITNTSDVPLTNMTFTGPSTMIIEVLDNTNQCVVYQESVPSITTDGKGMVSWPIGTGTITYATGGPSTIQNVLSGGSAYSVTACLPGTAVSGSPQTVNLSDGRAIQFSTDNGATWSTATLLTVGSVPYAFNADSLGGTPANNYVVTSGANPLTGNLNAGGFKINNMADPASAQDAMTLHYAATNFAPLSGNENFGAGNVVTTGNIGVGTTTPAANVDIESAASDALIIGSTGVGATTMSLNFDANSGATNRASIQASANSNTLNFSTGGVTAMSIAPNQTVTFNNSISSSGAIQTLAYLSLGTYATGSEPPAVAAGTMWYNSSLKYLRFYDGTGMQSLAEMSDVVDSLTAGTGITLGGTAQIPVVNVSALGGDLSGSITASNVAKLQGSTLTIAAPASGQVLSYNGAAWVNSAGAPGVPTLAAGSVVFSAGGTTLSQDNTNFFYNAASHSLGIGTSAPSGQLEVDALNATTVPEVIKAPAGSTVDLTDWKVGGGTIAYSLNISGTPVVATDLVNMGYTGFVTTTTGANYLKKDGSVPLTNTWDEGNQTIDSVLSLGIGVAAPAAPLDMKGALRLEGTATGYVGFQAATNVSTPVTWTLPPGDGSTGTVLSTNGSGVLTWSNGSQNFTGNLTGDVTGTQAATVVSFVGGSTAANVHAADQAVAGSTNNNTGSTLVRRDPTGNFSANTISAMLNSTGALPMNGFPINNLANPVNPQDAATMNFVLGSEAQYVPLTGGNMTGPLNLPFDGLDVGGTQFAVTSTGVGVGTTSPVGELDIYNPSPSSPANQLVVQSGSVGVGGASLTLNTMGYQTWSIVSNAPGNIGGAGALEFLNDSVGQARMVIEPNGYIGIGNTTAPMVSFDDGGNTDAIALPRGTTAQEPAGAAPGMIRYNLNTNAVEYFNGATFTWVPLSGQPSTRTVFNTAGGGTYTTPAGARQIRVRMIGGGGGSGGTNSTATSNGGGAGEYIEFFITNPMPSYPFQVGPGGSGGPGSGGATGGNGTSGTLSGFSSWTALGGFGGGGAGTTTLGAGGTGGSGVATPRIPGATGSYAGPGGAGPFGSYPAPGSGGNTPPTVDTAGTQGAPGIIIVDEYY